jgi:hypothetical protein
VSIYTSRFRLSRFGFLAVAAGPHPTRYAHRFMPLRVNEKRTALAFALQLSGIPKHFLCVAVTRAEIETDTESSANGMAVSLFFVSTARLATSVRFAYALER